MNTAQVVHGGCSNSGRIPEKTIGIPNYASVRKDAQNARKTSAEVPRLAATGGLQATGRPAVSSSDSGRGVLEVPLVGRRGHPPVRSMMPPPELYGL